MTARRQRTPSEVRSIHNAQPIGAVRATTRRFSFRLVREEAPGYGAREVTTPERAAPIARAAIGSEISECLIAIFVDARHRVIGWAECARGSLNVNRFAPRDVLIRALSVNACSVIVAHNHPSGDPRPSRADRLVTAALRSACDIVGIPLLDHLIVTDLAHHSFREDEAWDH